MVKLNKIIILLTMAVVLSAADAFAQQTFIIKGRVMEAGNKGASYRGIGKMWQHRNGNGC